MMAAEASLLRTLKQGLKPLLVRYENTLSKALTIEVALQSGIALTIMALVV